ncbi:MAG: bifunctional hydroxymethylpyrimidine kinase/phosphomethylpyrimidine kinase [Planctomycetota bacterium]
MNESPPIALTIAGSDPSGGAGLQADLKTFHTLGVYGASVVTLLTVQNTVGVQAVHCLPPELVSSQLEAVCADLSIQAAKTGALGNADTIEQVASFVGETSFPLIVDPVMISKHGHAIIDDTAVEILQRELMPHATLVTPNRHEAERLTGIAIEGPDSLDHACRSLLDSGAQSVLVKARFADRMLDCYTDHDGSDTFETPRQISSRTHGSGCVLSAAITALHASGQSLHQSIRLARDFVAQRIASASDIGKGIQPLNLLPNGHHVSTKPSQKKGL